MRFTFQFILVIGAAVFSTPGADAQNPCIVDSAQTNCVAVSGSNGTEYKCPPTTEDTCGNCSWSDSDEWTCTYDSSNACSFTAGDEPNGCVTWPNGGSITCLTTSIDMTTCATCTVINQNGYLQCDDLLVNMTFTDDASSEDLEFLDPITYTWSTPDGASTSGEQVTAPVGLAGAQGNTIQTYGYTYQIATTSELYTDGYRFSGVEWVWWPGYPDEDLQPTTTVTDTSVKITESDSAVAGAYVFLFEFKKNGGTTIYRTPDPTIYNPPSTTPPGSGGG